MRNLTNYNKFIKLNNKELIKEEMDIDTGGYGKGTGDVSSDEIYFANVKGNLAGAENTLVGAAALKLFGFIRRKGMQMYMKKVLKPRLGRVYMNGVLRYSNKNGIGNFSRKIDYNINKIVDNKAVKYENSVIFSLDGNNGINCFEVGATVTIKGIKKDNPTTSVPQTQSQTQGQAQPSAQETQTQSQAQVVQIQKADSTKIEDGKYILIYNQAIFECVDGQITSIDGDIVATTTANTNIIAKNVGEEIESEDIDINVSEEEFKEYKKTISDNIDRIKEKGIGAEDYIIEECDAILSNIKNGDADIEMIKKEKQNLLKAINVFVNGVVEIDEVLEKGRDNVTNYDEVEIQKLLALANMNKLMDVSNELYKILKDSEQAQQPQTQIQGEVKASSVAKTKEGEPVIAAIATVANDNSQNESLINEEFEEKVVVSDENLKKQNVSTKKNRSKTSRLGDDLAEIAKNGEAIDLNDKNFYKQFEKEGVREGVTKEILTDKASLVKIELDAQRIIAGNAKQQNSWDRMVENVKISYSKFMVTDSVDPKTLTKGLPPETLDKAKNDNNKSETGNQLSNAMNKSELDMIPKWKENTTTFKQLGGGFKENEWMVTELLINDVRERYIIKRSNTIEGVHYYRVYGKIDLDNILKDKEKYKTDDDFSNDVKPGVFGKVIGPKSNFDGGAPKAVYLASKSEINYGKNAGVLIITLYSRETSGNLNLNKPTSFYTIKNNNSELNEVNLNSGPFPIKIYGFKLDVDKIANWKINYPNKFGIDMNNNIEINSKSSVEKLKYVKDIYNKQTK